MTLFPDGDVSAGDLFVEHNTVSDAQFSPGLTVAGNEFITTSVKQNASGDLPLSFDLKQNYPNPFNPTTTIGFDLPRTSHVTINIYNINGQLVKTLVNKQFAAGSHEHVWNAADNSGQIVPSGLYFYQIKADGFSARHKMIMLK